MLSLGDKGTEVQELQHMLNVVGERDDQGRKLAEDGDFGPITDAALRTFQARHDLEVDGLAGPITMAALRRLVAGEQIVTPVVGDFAERVLRVAHIYHTAGVTEVPYGSNTGGPPAGAPAWCSVNAIQRPWFGAAGMAWCAMFVSQCCARAHAGLDISDAAIRAMQGEKLPTWPPQVSNWTEWARAKGLYQSAASYSPRPGDLFCLGSSHIGMVESYQPGSAKIATVEGNCNQRVASIMRAKAGSITHYVVTRRGEARR